MNITFLIGNGFDLNLGLRTKYIDFYKYYKENRMDDDRPYVKDFLAEIDSGEEWSDFELAFGKYGKNFTKENYKSYIDLWEDIQTSLSEYITSQQNEFPLLHDFLDTDAIRYLVYPDYFLSNVTKLVFQELRSRTPQYITKINVINFNYTKTFENIYNDDEMRNFSNLVTLEPVMHIHGTAQRNMILGVDNLSQLLCPDDVCKMPEITDRLIKPIANKNTLSLREQKCAEYIEKADIICVFGMSLGETDQTWWELVAKQLKNADVLLIIFAKDDSISPLREYLSAKRREDKIKDFMRVAKVHESEESIIKDKISVAFNSGLFEKMSNLARPDLSF